MIDILIQQGLKLIIVFYNIPVAAAHFFWAAGINKDLFPVNDEVKLQKLVILKIKRSELAPTVTTVCLIRNE